MWRDPSKNRTYLTASNNRFQKPHEVTDDPEVLAEIRLRNSQLAQYKPQRRAVSSLLRSLRKTPSIAASGSTLDTAVVEEGTMASTEEIVDVHALPESSDEDEAYETTKSKTTLLPTPESTQPVTNKRPLAETAGNSRRPKRRKPSPVEEQKPSSQPPPASQTNTMTESQGSDIFLSQSSQKRRPQKYKKNNSSLWKPDSTPERPRKKDVGKLSVPDDLPSSPDSRVSKKGTDRLDLPKSFSSPVAPVELFIPNFDEIDHDLDTIDAGDETHAKSRRNRAGSSSSLSSADSLASIQLDKRTKHRLNNDLDQENPTPDVPPGYVCCPRCKCNTLREGLFPLKSQKDIRKLSHRESQKFCFDHRMRDAKRTWADAHYPDSDLDVLLAPTRLEKYLTDLVPIIQRKRKSFYLDKLDEAIGNAKGNQRKLNHFFQTDIISLTHNGYYGPRGAKRLSLAIASDEKITKQFRRAEKSDKAFRSANLARAVDSILLPELLTMLVQDDMYLTHDEDGQAQARKILEDSEEVGILLCGDDNDEVDDTKENEIVEV